VRDFVLELSMNDAVDQALPHDELAAIFREGDAARGSLMQDALDLERSRRQPVMGGADGDMEDAIRTAMANI